MAAGIEFILKLKDLLSPAMKAAASAGQSAGTTIKQQFETATNSGKFFNHSIAEIKDKISDLEKVRVGTVMKSEFEEATRGIRGLNKELDKMNQASGAGGGPAGKSKGFGITDLIKGNLATQAINMAAGWVKTGITASIGAFADQQKQVTGLKTFLGDAGAKEAFENIRKDAAATPFDTASLLESNRALISAGASAKDARTDTMNLANAISAVGGGSAELSRMAANMQQIKTVGQATSMDIKQFGMAGINIYKLLSDETGKSIDQVKEMDVSYDLLSRSLARAAGEGGMYYGAMEAQSQTLSGRMATFKDNIGAAAAQIGEKLEPFLIRALDFAGSVAGKFGEWIEYLNPVFDIINKIPDFIGSIVNGTSDWSGYFDTVKNTATVLFGVIKQVAGNIWSILKNVIDWIGKSELIKDIFSLVGKASQLIWITIGQITNAIKWLWDKILKPILDGIDSAYRAVKSLVGGKTTLEVATKSNTSVITPINLNTPDRSNLAPVIPISQGNKDGDMNLGGSKSRSDNINSGGQRTINITIDKQIETMEIHVLNAEEGADEIEAVVRDAMRRVIYNINGEAA